LLANIRHLTDFAFNTPQAGGPKYSQKKRIINTQRCQNLLIATRQKLQHVNQPTLDLYLNGNRVEEAEEAEDEKLLGFKKDNHLTWHSHIEYLIGKLNSRIYLLKRAKGCRKLLFNALVKPIFEYCCSVWGNNPNDQLLRIFRVQKRCSRI